MKKVIIAIAMLFMVMQSYSQTDTVKYSVLLDNPHTISNYSFYIAPANIGVSASNIMTVGAEVGFRGTFFNKLKLDVNYNRALYYDNSYSSGRDGMTGKDTEHPKNSSLKVNQKFNRDMGYQLGLGYILTDKTVYKKVLLNLASQQTGNLIVNTVTVVDAQIRRRQNLRAGFIYKSSAAKLSNDDNKFFTDRGDELRNYSIKYADVDYKKLGSVATDIDGGMDWYINTSSSIGYIGYEVDYIMNYIVDTDMFGKRQSRATRTVYIDIMFGSSSFGNVRYFKSNPFATERDDEVGTEIIDYKIDAKRNNLKTRNVGFRVGYEVFGNARSKASRWENSDDVNSLFSTGYKIETGYRPGYNGGFYLLGTFCITLNR
jgi:hypothetical protein